ncbi:MAG: polyprenyl synthetase family protein [Thermodesulfobacteriota bacterium]|nr:polyprenyl synthetase family protein [Thermodesulfobacteriota bacterium]
MNQYMTRQTDDKAARLKEQIVTGVKDDLAAIEIELAKNLQPKFDLVAKVAGHILFCGGKRLRPLLMVLCARLCGYSGNHDKTYAAAFEYLHAATLLHDDLIDGGTLRRGKPAAYTAYGNETAVLTGDFLLARALAVLAMTENLDVVRTIVDITEQMAQGEIDQLDKRGRLEITEPEYLDIIRRKTAVLFQGACRVGALIADMPRSAIDALSDYGLNLGMAFQMADDLLDYTADADTLGKRIGTDLKEGKLTLPVISALQNAKEPDRVDMKAIINDNHFSADDFNRLVSLLQRCGGIDYTRRQAEKHIIRARAALDTFPSSKAKATLINIAAYALVRNQ